MEQSVLRKYFFFSLCLFSTILLVLLLWPFIKVIVLSIALSVVLYPVYRFLRRTLRTNWLAALLTVLLFIVILCGPLFIIGTIVLKQLQSLYAWIVETGGITTIVTTLNHALAHFFPVGTVNIQNNVQTMVSRLTSGIGTVFSATLSTLLSLLLIALSMFYFLKDGMEWKETLVRLSPLSSSSSEHILHKLSLAIDGVLKGYLLIALVQGTLTGIGLFIFHVPHAALWGLFAAVASLVPSIGTGLVTIPAVLYLFIIGRNGAGIGMAIWGAALVGTIDNFLNPVFVGRKIAIHPLLVLFSVLGGIALMGPVGILIGPLVVSLIYALTSVYKTEWNTVDAVSSSSDDNEMESELSIDLSNDTLL